jgi:CheY-like chemotaxis protein
MKVLVVEDNDDVRATVVEVLRMDPGITLFEAVNGSDAIDLAGRERPQVVVTDIMMAANGRPRSDETHQARLARNKGDCGDRVHPGRVPGSGI